MDDELKAMQEVADALDGLDTEAVARVLSWVSQGDVAAEELRVAGQVGQTLEGLDGKSAARVLRWAADRFDVTISAVTPAASSGATASAPEKAAPQKAAAAAPEKAAAAAPKKAPTQPSAASVRESEQPSGGEAAEPPPKPKDQDRPSFLDTQYRKVMAQRTIDEKRQKEKAEE